MLDQKVCVYKNYKKKQIIIINKLQKQVLSKLGC